MAHASVQPAIAGAAEGMLASVKGSMGPDLFGDAAVIPDVLDGDILTLEGERFDVLGPMPGDTGVITPVHLGSLDTLVASDVVYSDTHLWTAEAATPEAISAWRDSVDRLEELGAATVVPGHRTDTSANDASAFAHVRRYLDAWESALAETTAAEDLKAAIIATMGDLPGGFFLDRGAAAAKG